MADSGRTCDHCPGSHSGAVACHATATRARAWLLIEHPGPWGDRIEQMDLPGPLADAIGRADRLGVRPQLIRRTGRRRAVPPLQVYVGWSRGQDVWMDGRELADPAELADLDLAALATGQRPWAGRPASRIVPAGEGAADAVLLVCTHGTRNVCCARTGRPLARGLSSRFGDVVWETTHVGGHRYAANLVCLPHGLYYGNLGLAEGTAAAEAYLNGMVVLDRLRGRAGLSEPAQAAEHYVRAHTGNLGIDALTVESSTSLSAADAGTALTAESASAGPLFRCVVAVGGRRYRVTVEQSASHGCGSECNEDVRSYRLLDLTLLNKAALV